MESSEHNCPSCETPGQSPDVLIPNLYLRKMVTNFINETSYVSTKKPPVSTAAPSSSTPAYPAAATSGARTVVVKPDTLSTDVGGRPTELPARQTGLPPHLRHVTQIKPETALSDFPSKHSQQPASGSQLSQTSAPGGQQSAARTTAGDHYGYQPSRSVGRGTPAAHRASPSHLSSHHVTGYSQSAVVPVSGSSLCQSQSAPSLHSNNQPE